MPAPPGPIALLFQQCDYLFLVLQDLRQGFLIALDLILILLDRALIGENRLLIFQNLFLVVENVLVRHVI